MTLPSKACCAVAVVVTTPGDVDRFLIKITRIRGASGVWKVGRVMTAWHLAGATLFMPDAPLLEKCLADLVEDGRAFRTVDVLVAESS